MVERVDGTAFVFAKSNLEDAWLVPPAFESRVTQEEAKTVRERLKELLDLFESSGQQIREHYPQLGSMYSWYAQTYQSQGFFAVNTIFSPNVWLTAHPEQVFRAQTAYHVTSTVVLPDLVKGVGLLAPQTHAERKVVTHRGIGLAWMSAFIKIFGFSTWDKDFAVWMSAFVDNEQCTVEHAIAQLTPHELSLQLAKLFFGAHVSDLQECVRALQFDPQLHELLLNALGARKPLTPQQESYLQSFMWRFFELTGTREGWWEAINSFLRCVDTNQRFTVGEQTLAQAKVVSIRGRFQQSLSDNLLPLAQNGSSRDSAGAGVAVLQIDTERMFGEMAARGPYPLFPGPVTGMRDPRQIISSPRVDALWVQRVWVTNPASMTKEMLGELRQRGIEVEDIQSIPMEILMDQNATALLPTTESLSPANPLCARRYSRPVSERQADWLSLLKEGLVAPLKTLNLTLPGHQDVFMHMIGAPGLLYEGIPEEKRAALNSMLAHALPFYRVAGVFD